NLSQHDAQHNFEQVDATVELVDATVELVDATVELVDATDEPVETLAVFELGLAEGFEGLGVRAKSGVHVGGLAVGTAGEVVDFGHPFLQPAHADRQIGCLAHSVTPSPKRSACVGHSVPAKGGNRQIGYPQGYDLRGSTETRTCSSLAG
ncbi:MAG: hypothetical protein ACJ72N_23385, partial [Labedaea sp.]